MLCVNDLETKKEIYERWSAMVNTLAQAMQLMQTVGDDPNLKAIRKEGKCAGILRFKSQLNNYCEYYRRDYLEELARSLE